jgi:hypothetical protein
MNKIQLTDEEKRTAIIEAIRGDRKIGRYTCSMVDECHSDAELIAEYGTSPTGRLRTPSAALREARSAEALYRDHFNDIAATAF